MSLNLPALPAEGDPITAADQRKLIEAVRSLEPHGGPGIRVAVAPGGTTISADAGPAGGLRVLGVRKLYQGIFIREYDETGTLVAAGTESDPLATDHGLVATWDYPRVHA